MSHWQSGKIKLKCSIKTLQKALIDMMEEWKNHIYVSESGDLPLYTYQGEKDTETYNVVIPGCKNPNYRAAPGVVYSDIGIRKQEDGTWFVKADISGLPHEVRNFTGKLQASVAAIKVKQIAGSNNNKLVSDYVKDGKRYIKLITPVDEKFKIKA